jgi:hypothetical protein
VSSPLYVEAGDLSRLKAYSGKYVIDVEDKRH